MLNDQAGTTHRTTVQVAEPRLQSAEDYHRQYLYKIAPRVPPVPSQFRQTAKERQN